MCTTPGCDRSTLVTASVAAASTRTGKAAARAASMKAFLLIIAPPPPARRLSRDATGLKDAPAVPGEPVSAAVSSAASACYFEAANEGDPVMRAAVMRDARLLVDTLPDPVPGPGEILVRTLACGICGSDLHALRYAPRMVEAPACGDHRRRQRAARRARLRGGGAAALRGPLAAALARRGRGARAPRPGRRPRRRRRRAPVALPPRARRGAGVAAARNPEPAPARAGVALSPRPSGLAHPSRPDRP